MPLQAFEFSQKPDIRLVVYGDTVFKIKLSCRQSANRTSLSLMYKDKKNHADLERVISAVLLSQEELQPIATSSFVVYPYRKIWPTADELAFYQDGERLKANQYSYTFYVEERSTDQKPVEGKRGSDKDRKSRPDEEREMCETDQSTDLVSHTQQINEKSQSSVDITSLQPSKEEASPDIMNADTPGQGTEASQQSEQALTSPHACASFRRARSEPQSTRRLVKQSDGRRKRRRHSVSEYGQKNRHDIEEQDLREFLRFQQLASPEHMSAQVSDVSSTGLVRAFKTLVTPIKKLFGQD